MKFCGGDVMASVPVAEYPQEYIDKLLEDVETVKKKLATGQQPIFDTLEDLIADLEDE